MIFIDVITKRLMYRKQQTPRVKNRFMFEETSQCDISAGEAKIKPVEEFENEVEGIMDKFIEDKINAKQKIYEKYEEYFIETKMMKGDVRDKLEQELMKNMNKEIDDVLSEIDHRRNDEIYAARSKFTFKSLHFCLP